MKVSKVSGLFFTKLTFVRSVSLHASGASGDRQQGGPAKKDYIPDLAVLPFLAAQSALCVSSVRDVDEVVSPPLAVVHDAGNKCKVPYFMDFHRFPDATLADVIFAARIRRN